MGTRTAMGPAAARLNGHGVASGRDGLAHLIDVATLAEHLGLTERTIRRKVAQGEIPHYKLGHAIRFDPAEVQAWLETSRVAPHTPSTNGAESGMRP